MHVFGLRNPINEVNLLKCLYYTIGFRSGGGDSHMKQTGMLVGNFEFNP